MNKYTGRPATGKLELAKVKTGGSIYVHMRKVMKPIPISDDSKRNEKEEQE